MGEGERTPADGWTTEVVRLTLRTRDRAETSVVLMLVMPSACAVFFLGLAWLVWAKGSGLDREGIALAVFFGAGALITGALFGSDLLGRWRSRKTRAELRVKESQRPPASEEDVGVWCRWVIVSRGWTSHRANRLRFRDFQRANLDAGGRLPRIWIRHTVVDELLKHQLAPASSADGRPAAYSAMLRHAQTRPRRVAAWAAVWLSPFLLALIVWAQEDPALHRNPVWIASTTVTGLVCLTLVWIGLIRLSATSLVVEEGRATLRRWGREVAALTPADTTIQVDLGTLHRRLGPDEHFVRLFFAVDGAGPYEWSSEGNNRTLPPAPWSSVIVAAAAAYARDIAPRACIDCGRVMPPDVRGGTCPECGTPLAKRAIERETAA